jgi:hypothetical protein
MPAPSTTTFLAVCVSASAARAVDGLQIEEERLDHVLGDRADRQGGEPATLDRQRGVHVDLRALQGDRHDRLGRGVVRALELLAQVRRERREVLRELRVGRQPARHPVALDVPGGDPGVGVERDSVVVERHGFELVVSAERRAAVAVTSDHPLLLFE